MSVFLRKSFEKGCLLLQLRRRWLAKYHFQSQLTTIFEPSGGFWLQRLSLRDRLVEEQSLFCLRSERQINNPNRVDPFTGATRGMFRRFQLEYQTDISRSIG